MSGGGKETPRQKMIGMMYLFYTALLALNVSAEILSAFTLVDASLRKTNEITEGVIGDTQNEFVKAMVNDSAGVAPYKALADQVITEANKAYDNIQFWKEKLVFTLEQVENEQQLREMHENDQESYIGDLVSKKDDNNVGGQIFIQEGHSKEIQDTREAYRDFLISIVNKDTVSTEQAKAARASLINQIQQMLSTAKTKSENGEGDSIPWNVANFEHLPAAGVLALMTKMQADVRNTESSMLTYLLGQIGKSDMKFNAIKAVVNSPSSYVLVGQPYKAEVFIAAYDSTQNPDILVGGSPIPVNQGVGTFTGNTSSPGVKSWGGVIKLKNKSTGEVKEYPFQSSYEVGVPSVSVSPTKMNVFYIGVDNPVEISASGVPAEKVNASITGGGTLVRKSGAEWVVRVKSQGEVTINCSANIDGQTKSLGSKKFRVKRVPDPRAVIGTGDNKTGGVIAKNSLINQIVRAEMENFDFDLKFQIVQFTVSATVKGFTQSQESRSSSFTAAQKQIISQVPANGKVYIEDIKAKGPDGSVRNLSPIKYTVK